MFHLVYFSSATKEFTKPELQKLLDEGRKKNSKLGVTGMLLYKDGNFMQVLEGEEKVVTKLISTIEARLPAQRSYRRRTRYVGAAALSRLVHGIPGPVGFQYCQDAWLQRLHEYPAYGRRIHKGATSLP